MKKILSLLLCSLLILNLFACGAKSETTVTTEAVATQDLIVSGKAPEGKLLVGFGRVNISPPANGKTELFGYGSPADDSRLFTSMLDPIYGTCVAITDTEGNTALIYTMDTLYTLAKEVNAIRAEITKRTGIPGENVIISGTHTHSSVYYTALQDEVNKMAQAAEEALTDRGVATVQTGKTDILGMNFVRHYYNDQGVIVGDNFGSYSNPVTEHVTEADTQLQMIRFVREGEQKDILMANWQVHPKLASGGDTESGLANRNFLSADFIGFTRMEIEKKTDCLFAYYSGACGNVNPTSRISSEWAQVSTVVNEYGLDFAGRVMAAMDGLQDTQAGMVKTQQTILQANVFNYGKYPNRHPEMELTAIRIGNIGFAAVPFEMFDTSGMQLKEGSDCETTFVLTNASCEEHEYIPNIEVWDYDTNDQTPYEIFSCAHEKGTAEQVVQELVKMLNELGK